MQCILTMSPALKGFNGTRKKVNPYTAKHDYSRFQYILLSVWIAVIGYEMRV